MGVQTSFTITGSLDLATDIKAIDQTGTDAAADTSYTFTFDLAGGASTLTLAAQLDAINLDPGSSLTIAGSGDTLNGAGSYRGLFVYAGTVTVENLTIADASVQGRAAVAAAAAASAAGRGSAAACSWPAAPA